MIIIPPEEVDEFLANESRVIFTEEQLDFFILARKRYREYLYTSLVFEIPKDELREEIKRLKKRVERLEHERR